MKTLQKLFIASAFVFSIANISTSHARDSDPEVARIIADQRKSELEAIRLQNEIAAKRVQELANLEATRLAKIENSLIERSKVDLNKREPLTEEQSEYLETRLIEIERTLSETRKDLKATQQFLNSYIKQDLSPSEIRIVNLSIRSRINELGQKIDNLRKIQTALILNKQEAI